MAARTRRKLLSAEHREKIKVSQLLNALQNHALNDKKMGITQIKAAEVLLRKCLPDLKAMEVTGEGGGAIQINVNTDASD